jgi:hypothetical protein
MSPQKKTNHLKSTEHPWINLKAHLDSPRSKGGMKDNTKVGSNLWFGRTALGTFAPRPPHGCSPDDRVLGLDLHVVGINKSQDKFWFVTWQKR